MASVTLDAVTFRYPGSRGETLEALSLMVPDQSTHALLGASGAGKTTVLNLLSGSLQPTSGQILLDGMDVSRLPSAQRNVTQVFQFPVLYPAMTVAENLQFPLRNRGWKRPDALARAIEIARELDIEPLLGSGLKALTLFERQLVAIGRALVRPDVGLVLLDEPLTAVQPELKWQLRKALRKVQTDLGVTMIYVTHDQTEALTFAAQVSVMQGGRILQTGSPHEIHDKPAHDYVGFFIGSPGMNFLDINVRQGRVAMGDRQLMASSAADGDYRIGFRAEWARLGSTGIPITITGFRADGLVDDVPVGIVTAEFGSTRLHVRHRGDLPSTDVCLEVQRYLLFKEGRRVD